MKGKSRSVAPGPLRYTPRWCRVGFQSKTIVDMAPERSYPRILAIFPQIFRNFRNSGNPIRAKKLRYLQNGAFRHHTNFICSITLLDLTLCQFSSRLVQDQVSCSKTKQTPTIHIWKASLTGWHTAMICAYQTPLILYAPELWEIWLDICRDPR